MVQDLAGKVMRFRWLIFIVLSLAYFFVYFHRLSLSVVANDLITDFQTTASVMGFLGSIYFYCYAIMQFPAGLLSDSLGPRKSVTFFLLIASAGSIIFGFAPTIKIAFIGRVMVGLGVSMVFIPTMKIFSRWFRPHEFAFMTGILNAVGGTGVLAATWLLAIMTLAFGWRISFEVIGCLTFVIVALVWFIVSIYPSGLPRMTLYILFFVFSVCSSSVVILGFTIIKELFPTKIAGTSTGFVNLFPFLGGAVFMPLLGRVLDAYPKSPSGGYSLEAYSMLIFILLGASVLSLICTLLTKETFQN